MGQYNHKDTYNRSVVRRNRRIKITANQTMEYYGPKLREVDSLLELENTRNRFFSGVSRWNHYADTLISASVTETNAVFLDSEVPRCLCTHVRKYSLRYTPLRKTL